MLKYFILTLTLSCAASIKCAASSLTPPQSPLEWVQIGSWFPTIIFIHISKENAPLLEIRENTSPFGVFVNRECPEATAIEVDQALNINFTGIQKMQHTIMATPPGITVKKIIKNAIDRPAR